MSNQVIDGKRLKQMILGAAGALEAEKDTVNALNVFPVPDGDTGTNMSMTITSAVREVQRAKDGTVSEVAAALAQGSLMGARGNSGVILSQLFRGFARFCDGKATLDGKTLAQAFQEGVDTAYKAVMKPVEGTILTVARESAAAAMQASRRQADPVKVMKAVVEAADKALAKTPDLLPVLKKAGVVDSGGKGLAVILHGYYTALVAEGLAEVAEEVPAPAPEPEVRPAAVAPKAPAAHPAAPVRAERHDVSPAAKIDFKVDAEISEITFPYDCELFIRRRHQGAPVPLDLVARQLEPMGDSIYVVGGEDLAKVHIHSSNPGPVLSLCIMYGDLIDIVIHNMIEQHEDLLGHAGRTEAAPEPEPVLPAPVAELPTDDEQPESNTCVVSVAAGEGVEAIFRSLGVHHIIRGGQTMNPSTQDLLDAINACRADEVFVLPNNKNIILAAEQAAAIATKHVHVVPSRSIPQGIAAMLSWNPEGERERLAKAMTRAMTDVQTGEITFSVRDTVFGEISIKEGDILGLWNGEIKLTGANPDQVLTDLLAQMVAEQGGEVISVYWGEGVDEARAERLGEQLRQRFPEHEVDLQYGGQPLYYYVFSLE